MIFLFIYIYLFVLATIIVITACMCTVLYNAALGWGLVIKEQIINVAIRKIKHLCLTLDALQKK